MHPCTDEEIQKFYESKNKNDMFSLYPKKALQCIDKFDKNGAPFETDLYGMGSALKY